MRRSHLNLLSEMSGNSNTLSRSEKRGKIDFPLYGPPHPSTINHHHQMKELSPNQIRFTASDLIGMLHHRSTRNCRELEKESRKNQSFENPRNQKGMYFRKNLSRQPVVQNHKIRNG